MSEADIIKRQKLTIDNLSKQLEAVKKERDQLSLKLSGTAKELDQAKFENRRNWNMIKTLNTENEEFKHTMRQLKGLVQNCGG